MFSGSVRSYMIKTLLKVAIVLVLLALIWRVLTSDDGPLVENEPA